MTARKPKQPTFDIDTVRAAASHRWPEILSHVGGIDRELLDGEHHGCPKPGCGGTDRFRMIDAAAGALLCNQCHKTKNGDGFAAVQWLLDISFPDALAKVADYLGVEPKNATCSRKKTKKASSAARLENAPEWVRRLKEYTDQAVLENIAVAKGVTVEALRAFGATVFGDRAAFPMFGPDCHQCSYFTLTADTKGMNAKGKPAGLFAPSRSPEPGETWLIVEGVKDAAALHALGYLVIGLPCSEMNGKFAPLFRGVHVIDVPDLDKAGQQGSDKTAERLSGIAASIKIARLPGVIKESKGDDVRDVLKQPDGESLVRKAIDEAADWVPPAKPKIIVTTDESDVVDEAIAAIAKDPGIFQRSGGLVRVIRSDACPRGVTRPADAPQITELPLPTLREKMAAAARWVKLHETSEGIEEQNVHPPDWCVKATNARGQWEGIRQLECVVESPVLRPDGSVLSEPGYDEATGLLYEPRGVFAPIPEAPSLADAQRACAELLETIVDFPLGDADRSGWLAGVLTPFARFAFNGPAPLFSVEATVRGSGKSLLVDTISEIAAGGQMARMSNPESDDEMAKRITSLAMGGERYALIDNVGTMLGGASLDAALTGTSWKARVLGTNRIIQVPLVATWYATGNNLTYNGDTIRRVVCIRIESEEERPEERTGFRHPRLLAWVRRERPRLASAPLTILRAFCVAGRPGQGLTPWGSFEEWSALVRQAIVWAGMADPAKTRHDLASHSDRDASSLAALIAGWEQIAPDGKTVAGVFRLLDDNFGASRLPYGHPDRQQLQWDELRAAIAETAGKPLGHLPSPRSFGMRLNHLRGRVSGGKKFTATTENGTKVWKVEAAAASGTTGTKGTTSINPEKKNREVSTCHINGAHTQQQLGTAEISPRSPLSPRSDQRCSTCGGSRFLAIGVRNNWTRVDCASCGHTFDNLSDDELAAMFGEQEAVA